MDLNTVVNYRYARTRADLALGPGERIMGGGTWLFSEPQVDDHRTGRSVTRWAGPPWNTAPTACGSARPARSPNCPQLPERAGWTAHPLFFQCATALLASFKIWNVATVGGNICRSFAAAAMVSLCVALDGIAADLDTRRRRTPVASRAADHRERHEQSRDR